MNETLEQKVLRIAADYDCGTGAEGEHYAIDTPAKVIEFARLLLAETGQEPVAFATNGYGKISLYWREGLVIDFIPNGTTIGLYASPQLLAETGQGEPVAWRCRGRASITHEWEQWSVKGFRPQGPESSRFQIEPLYASPQLLPDPVAVPIKVQLPDPYSEHSGIWMSLEDAEKIRSAGLLLAPKKATKEMENAGNSAYHRSRGADYGVTDTVREIYRAMLAAHEEKS